MEKFSSGNIKENPYVASSIKGELYEIVKEHLKSEQGNIVGIEKFVEEISSIFEKKSSDIQISILEDIKNFVKKDEIDAEPDDISVKINDMIPEEENILTDEIEEEEIKESLTEDQIDYMIKKINS
jgi:hypothetical protein